MLATLSAMLPEGIDSSPTEPPEEDGTAGRAAARCGAALRLLLPLSLAMLSLQISLPLALAPGRVPPAKFFPRPVLLREFLLSCTLPLETSEMLDPAARGAFRGAAAKGRRATLLERALEMAERLDVATLSVLLLVLPLPEALAVPRLPAPRC